MTEVNVNYDILDYLPDDAPSTEALHTLNDQYSGGVPNARVMVNNITIPQALELKKQIAAVEGVDSITWLDDEIPIETPLEYLDSDALSSYYRDGSALFTLTLDSVTGRASVKKIKEVVGEDSAMSGTMVSMAFSGDNMSSDLQKIMLLAFPIILLILLATTDSWFEPILFLFTIGVAIIINMGTNLIFGEISFITKGIAALLQLAIAIDYAIFLLHRFGEYMKEGMPVETAMGLAMKNAALSIWTSGVTAAIGFAALMVMRLKIGPDIGLVMVKGIIVSLICVFTLLPAITVCCHKLIEKTHHRSFIPSFKKFAKFTRKCCIPCLIIMVIILIPCIIAVENTDYVYIDIYNDPNSPIGMDIQTIKDKFGDFSPLVLMVEKGNAESEKAVQTEIEAIPVVTNVLSYTGTVGAEIPVEYVPEKARDQLISEEYTRYVITVDAKTESQEGFAAVEELRRIGDTYYPGHYHLAGEIANSYDLKKCVTEDDLFINLIAVGGIFLVLLLIFRSLIIPAILVFAIDAMIWINCSIPYFAGTEMFYIVRMVIFALQLAATVDYAILFASRYFEYRKTQKKQEALESTVSTAFISILTSAAILFVCGLILALISTNSLLAAVGVLVARGAVLSIVSVMFVLPALLIVFDGLIQKLSLKMKFLPNKSE